jgi:hypothetical protein
LLDNHKLVNQLVGLERRTSRGGRDSIDHPSHGGAHDDVANAVAGVLTSIAVPEFKLMIGTYGPLFGSITWDHDIDREMSNAEKNACHPGRGLDPAATLFNAQRGIYPPWRR